VQPDDGAPEVHLPLADRGDVTVKWVSNSICAPHPPSSPTPSRYHHARTAAFCLEFLSVCWWCVRDCATFARRYHRAKDRTHHQHNLPARRTGSHATCRSLVTWDPQTGSAVCTAFARCTCRHSLSVGRQCRTSMATPHNKRHSSVTLTPTRSTTCSATAFHPLLVRTASLCVDDGGRARADLG
jgi:hypothetical protein